MSTRLNRAVKISPPLVVRKTTPASVVMYPTSRVMNEIPLISSLVGEFMGSQEISLIGGRWVVSENVVTGSVAPASDRMFCTRTASGVRNGRAWLGEKM